MNLIFNINKTLKTLISFPQEWCMRLADTSSSAYDEEPERYFNLLPTRKYVPNNPSFCKKVYTPSRNVYIDQIPLNEIGIVSKDTE